MTKKFNMIREAMERALDDKLDENDDPVFKVYTRGGHILTGEPLVTLDASMPEDQKFNCLWFVDDSVIIRESDIVAIEISYLAEPKVGESDETLAAIPPANTNAI